MFLGSWKVVRVSGAGHNWTCDTVLGRPPAVNISISTTRAWWSIPAGMCTWRAGCVPVDRWVRAGGCQVGRGWVHRAVGGGEYQGGYGVYLPGYTAWPAWVHCLVLPGYTTWPCIGTHGWVLVWPGYTRLGTSPARLCTSLSRPTRLCTSLARPAWLSVSQGGLA